MTNLTQLSKNELIQLIPIKIFRKIPSEFWPSIDREELVRGLAEMKHIKEFKEKLIEQNVEVDYFETEFSERPKNMDVEKKFYELLDYQYYIRNKVLEEIKLGVRKQIIHMPTGTGKTKTTCHILSELINQRSNVKVLWVAHEEILVEQGHEEFSFTFNIFKQKHLKITNYKKHKINSLDDDHIHFITYQTLNNLSNQGIFLDADIIICDECHKVLAKTFAKAIRTASKSDTGIVIGLSATPGRSLENKEENEELSALFDNNKVTFDIGLIKEFSNQKIVANKIFDYLYERKVLSKPDFKPFGDPYETVKNGQNIASKTINDNLENDTERTFEICKMIEKEAQEGRKIMVFASSIEHSNVIAFMLNCLSTNAQPINGLINKTKTAEELDNFKKAKTKVLVVVEKLTTGFDEPKVDCIFVVRDVGSLILFSQMIGRGLRGPLMGGTDECKIYHNKKYSIFEDASDMFTYFDQNY